MNLLRARAPFLLPLLFAPGCAGTGTLGTTDSPDGGVVVIIDDGWMKQETGSSPGDARVQVAPLPDGGEEAILCKPCIGPEHCGGVPNWCVTSTKTGENICALDCSGGAACPPAYDCLTLPTPTGGDAQQCLPRAGTCQPLPEIPELAPGSCGDAVETEVVNRVNQIRAQHGLPAYACDAVAQYVARKYSQYMCDAGFFAHVGPDGLSPGQRLAAAGAVYKVAGENICQGATSPAGAVDAWMNSPGHRKMILSPTLSHVGSGVIRCTKNGVRFWTLDFLLK